MTDHPDRRQGLAAGISAYALWGLFPLYWPLLKPAGAFEILAQRIVWSFLFVLVLLLVLRASWRWVPMVFDRRVAPRLVAMSVLVAINWVTYILAVNTGHVVETSVGYFINPLVSVALGVLLFKERLDLVGRIGVAFAFAGVAVLAWGSLGTLWISLTLAFSFGLYGVAKKRAPLPALPGLLVESTVLLLPALAFLIYLGVTGGAQFGRALPTDVLMAFSGPATVLPLWLFALATVRLTLGTVGILQYLAPTTQFILGITLFGQQVSAAYWAGLVLVWVGCAVYLFDTLRGTGGRGTVAPQS
nr:EamA family transporter RarD [Propionibacterium sp.]